MVLETYVLYVLYVLHRRGLRRGACVIICLCLYAACVIRAALTCVANNVVGQDLYVSVVVECVGRDLRLLMT